jgi:type 1 glutamine amidotransferase
MGRNTLNLMKSANAPAPSGADGPSGGWRAAWAGSGIRLVLAAALFGAPLWARAAESHLRILVVGGDSRDESQTRETLGALASHLAGGGAAGCEVEVLPAEGEGLDLTALRASDVAVLWVRGRKLGAPGAAALRQFVEGGRGLVVLGAGGGVWNDWPEFAPEILGVRPGGTFAPGASLRVINLFPHPILTGVERFEAPESIVRCEVSPEVQVVMEGTAGEETAPLGWVRRWGRGRVVGIVAVAPSQAGDADFLRLVSNSVRWAAERPIPGAQTVVQRTSMADAFPGALAICFPAGPSLCYDTVRGGINYIWNGDFVDLHPWWTTRHGEPMRAFAARYSGEVIYRDKDMTAAMHVGTRGEQSAYHFRGYRLRGDGFPELYYTVGGREVTEDLVATADGIGVVRTFHVAAGAVPLWLKVSGESGAEIAVGGAERDGDLVHFDAAGGGEFSVTIRRGANLGQ